MVESPGENSLVLMKLLMFFVVLRPVVESFGGRELDVIDELHVGTLVDFVRVASGVIRNVEADWTPGLHVQWPAIDTIDEKGFVSDRFQRDAGVEVVERAVQANVFRRRPDAGQFQQTAQLDRVAFPFGIELTDVNDSLPVVDRLQLGERQRSRFINFAVDA